MKNAHGQQAMEYFILLAIFIMCSIGIYSILRQNVIDVLESTNTAVQFTNQSSKTKITTQS